MSAVRCSSCASEVPPGQRFCGACGTVVPAVSNSLSAPTSTRVPSERRPGRSRTGAPGTAGQNSGGIVPPGRPGGSGSGSTATSASSPVSGLPSSDPSGQGRFFPGTMVAGRYRIVGILGRGGMGEVYRADDLKLGQSVALKFLPAAFESDPGRLGRFLGEVRTARQVTHPNVCRVYDIGEVDGQHYISMEYVDGEDLGTLLRRIGRLPKDKAVQIARQMCAGLAAAHEEGILHRDLKPANIMIDGRGRARITDFGLAGLAEGFEGAEVRAGTPIYMAPEQLEGKQVTVRSDLYSLGLVLYELFTGKEAFEAKSYEDLIRLKSESTPASPSSHVEGFDPAVERIILRCIDPEPARRPQSALTIAAALPGGDPLAEALAAGETPSPEMVAAAGPEGGMKPAIAKICFAAVILLMLPIPWFSERNLLVARVPISKSVEALTENAREAARALGYDEEPEDSVAWMHINFPELIHVAGIAKSEPEWEAHLSRPGHWLTHFHYRQSDGPLAPAGLWGDVTDDDPPAGGGDVAIRLDMQGNLVHLRATPDLADHEHGPSPEPDWKTLFEAAGLDITTFDEAAPTLRPQVFGDARAAWTGVLPALGGRPGRVEAIALEGRPVYFTMASETDWFWSPETVENARAMGPRPAFFTMLLTIMIALALGAMFLAIRHLRVGRGDRAGAMKLAIVALCLRMLHWALTGHHVAALEEAWLIVVALGSALLLALAAWVLYMALEPYVRSLWPRSLVSWSRLLAGRYRDPLVGRDVLVGCVAAVALNLATGIIFRLAMRHGGMFPIPDDTALELFRGGRFALGNLVILPLIATSAAMVYVVMLLILRIILRIQWLAVGAFFVLYTTYMSLVVTSIGEPTTGKFVMGLVFGVIFTTTVLTLALRFGLLALIGFFLGSALGTMVFTTDVSSPAFATSLIGPVALVALAVWAFVVSLAGRPVFSDALAGDAKS